MQQKNVIKRQRMISIIELTSDKEKFLWLVPVIARPLMTTPSDLSWPLCITATLRESGTD